MSLNIICRFGVPQHVVHDNGPQFKDHHFQRFCDKNHIRSHASTAYNPAPNGLAEAFNKTISKILKKMVAKNKREWSDKLLEALWANRTTVRGPAQEIPFSLVFGVVAVFPREVQIPSLRITVYDQMTLEQNP